MVECTYFVYEMFHIFRMLNIALIDLNGVWQILKNKGG